MENLHPQIVRQVMREVAELSQNPPEGIKVIFNEDDITDIQATIEGPGGTPYEGGLFKMKLVLPKEFPASPPQGFFLTKIFHPNVASNGAICVNTLKRDWKPDQGIRHILLVSPSPFGDPYTYMYVCCWIYSHQQTVHDLEGCIGFYPDVCKKRM